MHATPKYRTVAQRGPDHAKEFTVEVSIGTQVHGCGVGHSKQAAAQAAAADALAKLQQANHNARLEPMAGENSPN
jgi:ribonuclease-3